jgi:pyruvate kinase
MMHSITELKRTKIIATLGPASLDDRNVPAMIQAGVDLFRFNASHYSEPSKLIEDIKIVRTLIQKSERQVALLLDLQGPKIRVGKFGKKHVALEVGQQFILTPNQVIGDEHQARVSYPEFVQDVAVGESVFIDDGKIRLLIKEKKEDHVICEVTRGGKLSNFKGVNLPTTRISISALTKKDREDIKVLKVCPVEYVAMSFVSIADDIDQLRSCLNKMGANGTKIAAKIERQMAIDNLIPIIDTADVVMVARGDLGVEIGVEQVPKIQKMIIRECNNRIKPVIVATQMLESMISSETATRAEVSDVANAVYDHCDAVMLSAETAMGINPPNVISVMRDICEASDRHINDIKRENSFIHKHIFSVANRATSFCKAADQIAEENNAKAIMVFTSSGTTATIASKLHSIFPIISPTDDEFICNQMMLFRGVIPLLMPKKFHDIHRWTDMIMVAVKESERLNLLKKGDTVVVTAGIPIGQSNGINSIRIITV